nr:uncharacterized protein LOC109782133 isoform X6 [Aegilops tauschii subsp. strangulata]
MCCREKEKKGMDEQGAEVPEEEGQGRWGDMHVQGGPSPSPPLIFPCTAPAFNHHNHINGQARGLRRTPPPPPPPRASRSLLLLVCSAFKGIKMVPFFGSAFRPLLLPPSRVWWTTSSGSCSRCRRMAAARRASSPRSPPSSSTTPTGSSTTSAACWTPAEPSHHSPPRPSLVTCRARFFLPRTILSFASTAGGRASHAPTGAWRELLSTTPATGTWKTQSTVPPMNKAETSIVRIPVRMMLDLLLEHLGLHKAI